MDSIGRLRRIVRVALVAALCSLVAAPVLAQRVKLAVWGDSRENLDNAVGQIAAILEKDVTDWDAVVHTGDLTHGGSEQDWQQSLAFPGFKALFQAGRFLLCTSNHDSNRTTWDRHTSGILPTNTADKTTHFYAWKKHNVHVLVLDGHFTPANVLQQWLDTYLANVPASDWIVAVWHEPPYAGITYKGAYARAKPWLQSLYERGATVVLNGHAHSYVRTKPLAPDGTVDETRGIVYVVNGAGGASWKGPQPMTPKTAFTPRSTSFPCITFLTFQGDRLELETMDARPDRHRQVIDRWETTRRPVRPAGK